MSKSLLRFCACPYILLLSTLPAFGAAITSNWMDSNGNWSVSGNWTNGIPNNGGGNTFTAVLSNGSAVHLDISATINNLTIGSVDSLAVNNAIALTLNSGTGAGSVANNGNITLNSTTDLTELQLIGGGTITLSGSGMVTMGNAILNRISGVSGSTALTIGANQLVQGAGQIVTTTTNNGTITANQSAGLTLDPNATDFTNNGLIQSISPGSLTLLDGLFTNTSGTILFGAGSTGTVGAVVNGGPVTLSANSTLNLSAGTIHGGTLTNSSTGIINAVANTSNTLGGTVNNLAGGQFAVNDGAVLKLEGSGTYTNNGNIALNSSGSLTYLQLIGGGTVTLGGNGMVTMGNDVLNRIYGVNGTTALVIGASELVQGAGQIGVGQTAITNNGTITANQSAGLTLSPNATGFTNNGTLQATNGDTLTLYGAYTNTSGMIQASGAGSIVNLTSGTISGGTFTITNGGAIDDNGTAAVSGVMVNNGTLGGSGTTTVGSLSVTGTFTKQDSGTATISGPESLNSGASLNVNGDRLKFTITSGSVTVGTGVSAKIAAGATLELAGSVSALASGSNRANITNSSAAPGILVSGTNQVVGGIDGSGTTQVNAGSDLTANHIVQSALVIGGTAGSAGLVTIAASDSAGNPLGQSNGLALAGSLTPSDPIGADGIGSAGLSGGGSELASPPLADSTLGGNPSSVPEPSTLLLVLLAITGLASQRIALRPCSPQ
jgi:hypothetical protein